MADGGADGEEVVRRWLHRCRHEPNATAAAGQDVRRTCRGSVQDYRCRMVASYREYASPMGLKPLVACLWVNDRARTRPQRVVPDGCVDLMWFGESGLMVAGADTGPRVVEPVGASVAGIRLRPGTAGAVLGLPASEVCDQHVDASFLWGEEGARLGERMAAAEPSRHLGMLTEAVLRRGAAPGSAGGGRGAPVQPSVRSSRRRRGGPRRQRASAAPPDDVRRGLRTQDAWPGSRGCAGWSHSTATSWRNARCLRATRARRT